MKDSREDGKDCRMKKHWGIVNADGVDFFLEEGRALPPLCPVGLPESPCPHRTVGERKRAMPYGIFFYSNEEGFSLPEEIETPDRSLTYGVYTGVSSARVAGKYLRLTNYIPYVITGVKLDNRTLDFFNVLYSEFTRGIRPIVLVGDSVIPLPRFIKRVK